MDQEINNEMFQIVNQPRPEEMRKESGRRVHTSKLGRVADIYFAPSTLMITFPTVFTGAAPATGRKEGRGEAAEEETAQDGGFRPIPFPDKMKTKENIK